MQDFACPNARRIGEIVYNAHDFAYLISRGPMQVLSRTLEQDKIRKLMTSAKPELVAVYGRRELVS
jgi:hypothetical protein